MKVHSSALLSIGIAAVVLIVLMLIPKNAFGPERLAVQPAAQPKEARESSHNGVHVQTVKHDGHMFVTAQTGSSYGAASIIHHPDCKCLKPKER